MSKSFRRSDEESFKTMHRPRSRKVRDEEFLVDSAAVSIEDLPEYDRTEERPRSEPRR